MQTAQIGLRWLIEDKHVPVILKAEWQENSLNKCDTGTSPSTLAPHFPAFDFSTVDPLFPSKTGRYAFTREAVRQRAADCRAWLRARPEKVIAVVSHSGFLRVGVSNCAFANADFRVFEFADAEKPSGLVNGGSEGSVIEDRLVEWELTRERGGGMGRSDKGWFEAKEDYFDLKEEPPAQKA